jgi:hypothetical protein
MVEAYLQAFCLPQTWIPAFAGMTSCGAQEKRGQPFGSPLLIVSSAEQLCRGDFGGRRQSFLGLGNDHRKTFWFMDRHVGQNFAVQLDVG